MSIEFQKASVAFEHMPGVSAGVLRFLYGETREILPSNDSEWEVLVQRRREHRPLITPELAQTIAEHQRQWGAGEKSIQNAAALADAQTLCVVTGQQPGLCLGPMFTLLKALTAVVIAKELETVAKCRVVPVFWNASDDSDLEEVAETWILDRDSQPSCFRLDFSGVPSGTMIGSLPIDVVDFSRFERWFRESAQETEFLTATLSMLEETWSASSRFAEWFSRIVHRLLPDSGLVIFESALLRSKELTRRFWETSLKEQGLLHRLLGQSESSLRQIGVAPRLSCRPDDTGWFAVRDGMRHPIASAQDGLRVADQLIRFDELVDDTEIDLKPGAAYRSLVQDTLFPNVAIVVGPHELEYHMQLQPLYEHFGVFRPKVLLRFSGAIVESKVARFLNDYGLQAQELFKPERELEKNLFRLTQGREITEWAERLQSLLSDRFKELESVASELGEDILAPVHKKRDRVLQEIASLEDILVRRASQRDAVLRNRLTRAKSALFPDDQWQERRLSPFYFLAKYGSSFLEALGEELEESSDDAGFHFLNCMNR